MLQANSENTTPHGLNITADEALFLHCMLECQSVHGAPPMAELDLPRSIDVVVDYDHVKRLMHSKMAPANAVSTKIALKVARTKLMQAGVVGCHDPFVWFTGRPIG